MLASVQVNIFLKVCNFILVPLLVNGTVLLGPGGGSRKGKKGGGRKKGDEGSRKGETKYRR